MNQFVDSNANAHKSFRRWFSGLVWFAFDSCFSGLLTSMSTVLPSKDDTNLEKLFLLGIS